MAKPGDQEPGASCGSPTWVQEPEDVGPPPLLSQAIAESWIRSGAAGTPTWPIWDPPTFKYTLHLSRHETDGAVVRVRTEAEGLKGVHVPLELVFHLPASYPLCLPGISVHSEHLTRTQCEAVRGKLLERAAQLVSEPMVHELLLWIQQHLGRILAGLETKAGSPQRALPTSTAADDGLWMTLLHLDHMRARAKYIKTVETWASDLRLTGRLMFLGKIILILLQGDRNNIKEYLILQKTSKVDVDSSGKKCKEKMISVLFETKVQTEHKRFLAFEVKEYSALDELQKEFETAGLRKLFSEFVLGLIK